MAECALPPRFRLDVENLSARRGGRIAFAGATMTINPGEVFLLAGPNGAGKSTLLRVLAGRLRPDSGVIRLNGFDGGLHEAATLIGHADGVKCALTAAENLDFWRSLYGADEARVTHAVSALGVTPFLTQRGSTLSQGQRRRVALCRAVISGRPLWLLDEPAAGMDAASVARAVALIDAHACRGGAAVIATHDQLAFGDVRRISLAEAA